MPFLALGVGTALVYVLWVVWTPLVPNNLSVPLLDLGKITGYTWGAGGLYLMFIGCLFGLYAVGYRLVADGTVRLAPVFGFGAVLCAVLLCAYPATAADVFGYVAHGRLLAIHGANPFIRVPGEFPGDPIIAYLVYPVEPSQYGPVWVVMGAAVALLAQGNLLVEVLLYKGLGALALLGGAGLVFAIARRLGYDQARARASAYLYLWNPLLLWEMVANAHNDGLMMLLGLVAAWLFVAHVDLLVMPALAVGVLVKVPVALMAPVLFIGLWQRDRLRALASAGLAVAVTAIGYAPFWSGLDTLTALQRTDLFTTSPASVLRLGFAPSLGLPEATLLARWATTGVFAVVALLTVWGATRARTSRDILRMTYFMLLGGLMLATTWFQAWYVVWPFALGAALATPRRHLEVALLSLGALLQYFVFIYMWGIGVFPPAENLGVQVVAYAAIIGPLVLWAVATRGGCVSRLAGNEYISKC